MRALVRAALAVGGIALILTTAAQIRRWGDEGRLWAVAVARAPLKPRPWVNLGGQQLRQGDAAGARQSWEVAALLAQDQRRPLAERVFGEGLAVANLALLLADAGDCAGALIRLREVRAQRPVVRAAWEVETWVARRQHDAGQGDGSSHSSC